MDSDKEITAFFSGWSAIIESNGLYLGGSNNNKVTIGVGSEPFKRLAPPIPPWYSSHMTIMSNDTAYNVDIQLDGREQYIWHLSVDPHGNLGNPDEETQTILSWNSNDFNEQGRYHLIKGMTPETGEVVVQDMREITEYTVTGISDIQYFSIVWEKENCESGDCEQDCESTAMMDLTLSGENLNGAHTFQATIGRDKFEKITSAPPKPPSYSSYMAILSKDWKHLSYQVFDRENSTDEWLIVINPVGSGSVGSVSTALLSWSFPQIDEGIFQLVKVQFEEETIIETELLVDNMNTTNQYEISGDHTDQYFKIKYKCSDDPCISDPSQCEKSVRLALNTGWNLISLPLVIKDKRLKAIFPEAQEVYQFKDGTYELIEGYDAQLENGIGYWVSMPEDRIYDIHGVPYKGFDISVKPGWHLLGCPFESSSAKSLPDGAIESMFEYSNQSYDFITECQPGMGFWINVLDLDNNQENVNLKIQLSESK
jgi:hypothetical protein